MGKPMLITHVDRARQVISRAAIRISTVKSWTRRIMRDVRDGEECWCMAGAIRQELGIDPRQEARVVARGRVESELPVVWQVYIDCLRTISQAIENSHGVVRNVDLVPAEWLESIVTRFNDSHYHNHIDVLTVMNDAVLLLSSKEKNRG